MNNQLLTYLKGDGVGKVIAKGLADVYLHKPETPVKYLAVWLRQYSQNQQTASVLEQKQVTKLENLNTFKVNQEAEHKKAV